MSLLRSDEEVDAFDEQMSIAPVKEIKIDINDKFFVTADYVGITFLLSGDLQYRFARKEDIGGFNYAKTSGTGANPMRAGYFFDIVNRNNEKLLGGYAANSTQLDSVVELLKEIQPDLVIRNRM